MRVLTITPYVTIIGRKEFERNKTGFGYMVYDIAKAIANHTYDDGSTINVDVLATDSRGSSFDIERVHYLKRSLWLMARHVFSCTRPGLVSKLLKRYPVSNGLRIRLWYYWILTGYVDCLLDKGGYDVVHIHSALPVDELWMALCRKHGVKFVVTLHGLNSFSDTIKVEPAIKQYERDFLKRVAEGEIPITVISTGIKRIVERTYNSTHNDNIAVVCNAFSFSENATSTIDVRKKYNIPDDSKVVLYAGNISDNKNQKQLASSFALMSEGICESTYVLFCGKKNRDGEYLEKAIKDSKYASHLILCGGIDKELMPSYFSSADGVVLLSYAEGFGLSLVEGMHFGVPCMTFTDLDAFEDIFDENAVVAIPNRMDISVARSLEELLTRKWEKKKICESSKRFEAQTMANNYLKIYKTIITE